jgi:hypothetical protein
MNDLTELDRTAILRSTGGVRDVTMDLAVIGCRSSRSSRWLLGQCRNKGNCQYSREKRNRALHSFSP